MVKLRAILQSKENDDMFVSQQWSHLSIKYTQWSMLDGKYNAAIKKW